MPTDMIQPLTQFGVAGLMGVLWVWERFMSRKHELQLDAAHQRLMRQQDHLKVLLDTVHRNTLALERFEHTQAQLRTLLERMNNDKV